MYGPQRARALRLNLLEEAEQRALRRALAGRRPREAGLRKNNHNDQIGCLLRSISLSLSLSLSLSPCIYIYIYMYIHIYV